MRSTFPGMLLGVSETIWPLIAVSVLVVVLATIFRRTIEEVLIPRVSGVKVLGFEVSFAKKELSEAIESRGLPKASGDQKAALERAREAWPLLRGAEVLWVDDHPADNRREQRMLQAFGVMIDAVRTNSDAMMMLTRHRYDMVISDIARDDEAPDGIALADQIRLKSPSIPLIFYITDLDPKRGTPAYAIGITDRPDHLLHYVIDVVARSRRSAARG
jgi:CheY-like chemotaxis protein